MNENPKILAFSGKKQSGKNTSFNFLLGLDMIKLSIIREKMEIRSDGKLVVSDIFGDVNYQGEFDIDRNSDAMENFREEFIYTFIRNYSFADLLKTEVCINLFGLTWEQCYGTDDEKNSLTNLMWEDMPGVICHKPQETNLTEVKGRLGFYYAKYQSDTPEFINLSLIYHEPGVMTGREVMQFAGTEIFRKMYSKVWSNGTINRIKEFGSNMSVITDCRFPDEVKAVQDNGGKVIRFTRNPNPGDNHLSETSLDKENYDWDKFDAIIDNENMTISQQNESVYQVLCQWEWRQPLGTSELTTSE